MINILVGALLGAVLSFLGLIFYPPIIRKVNVLLNFEPKPLLVKQKEKYMERTDRAQEEWEEARKIGGTDRTKYFNKTYLEFRDNPEYDQMTVAILEDHCTNEAVLVFQTSCDRNTSERMREKTLGDIIDNLHKYLK